jgi:ferredoxin, 2Fe-2S
MPNVRYRLPDGSCVSVNVESGRTVMDGSVRNNLPGIVAECGGSCSCATCHVFLAKQYQDVFPAPAEEEAELLEYLEGVTNNSRLACQLILTADTPEIEVTVPSNN